jgi:hypothetical protein
MPFTNCDTVEHQTELLIWDSPRQLHARRAELASRVAEDQADDRQPEQQALARIDARLKELQAR